MGNYISSEETPVVQHQQPQPQPHHPPQQTTPKPKLSFEELIEQSKQELDSLEVELKPYYDEMAKTIAKMRTLQKLYEERLTVVQLKVDKIELPSITYNGEKLFDENARTQRKQLIQRAEHLINIVTSINLSDLIPKNFSPLPLPTINNNCNDNNNNNNINGSDGSNNNDNSFK